MFCREKFYMSLEIRRLIINIFMFLFFSGYSIKIILKVFKVKFGILVC